MRGSVPTIHCDECQAAWDVDNYEANVTAVNGVRVTAEQRAPGWTSTPDGRDVCPECAPKLAAAVLDTQEAGQ